MRRFFVDPENLTGSTAILAGSEAHHISKVLRLCNGRLAHEEVEPDVRIEIEQLCLYIQNDILFRSDLRRDE